MSSSCNGFVLFLTILCIPQVNSEICFINYNISRGHEQGSMNDLQYNPEHRNLLLPCKRAVHPLLPAPSVHFSEDKLQNGIKFSYEQHEQSGHSVFTVKRCATAILLIALVKFYFIYSEYISRPPYFEMKNLDPPYELFLISSYYYPQSKSLGDNAVALVLTGDFSAVLLEKVTIVAWNATHKSVGSFNITSVGPIFCRWVPLTIVGYTLPNMRNMSLVLGNENETIPFRLPVYKKHDVVTCIAPLFANEQWQYSLFAAHTYRRFGTHMHMYIRSMMTPIFDMLKVYEQEGYLTIQPWHRMKLKSIDEKIFNPNVNVEFRNQAAAQTDCLLQYKESAQFIAFMDLDDILIPRLGRTYLEEFNYFFDKTPNVAFIHYGKQNVEVKGHHSPHGFSLSQMYSSIRFNQHSETGKSVVKPELANATWIHWPMTVPDGLHRYDIPLDRNAISHLKHMDENLDQPDKETVHTPIFQPLRVPYNIFNVLLRKADIQWIQADFEKMQKLPSIRSVWSSMPTKPFYLDIIKKCYDDIYYRYHYGHQSWKITCPGPERCNFPKAPGFNCTNSVASYVSTRNNTKFNIHYMYDGKFRIEDGCRP